MPPEVAEWYAKSATVADEIINGLTNKPLNEEAIVALLTVGSLEAGYIPTRSHVISNIMVAKLILRLQAAEHTQTVAE